MIIFGNSLAQLKFHVFTKIKTCKLFFRLIFYHSLIVSFSVDHLSRYLATRLALEKQKEGSFVLSGSFRS